jgi:hypothetical protein
MPIIEQGILNPFNQTKVGVGLTGPIFAIVSIGGVSRRCVVKRIGHKEIAAECFCALLGDSLGLPVLKPVIVKDPLDGSLCFGTRDVGYPNLCVRLGIGDTADAIQLRAISNVLSLWTQVGEVISFDELILNGDRNPGNVLWDGLSFKIIDHERALEIEHKTVNKLAQFSTNHFDQTLMDRIQSASTAAAMSQMALLNGSSGVLETIKDAFSETPSEVGRYFDELERIVRRELPLLVSKASDAVSPLFARRLP